jgi:hypothetical protein
MIALMDDLIDTIAQVLMSTSYARPRRRRAAWQDDCDEELQYAHRVAEAIVGVVRASGYRISLNPPASPCARSLRTCLVMAAFTGAPGATCLGRSPDARPAVPEAGVKLVMMLILLPDLGGIKALRTEPSCSTPELFLRKKKYGGD